MKKWILFFFPIVVISCNAQKDEVKKVEAELNVEEVSELENYIKLHASYKGKSKSKGSVSKGSLENAMLFPYQGKNFKYFDKSSYLGGRAFLNNTVALITLSAYEHLAKLNTRSYTIMECSNEHGGKMDPHRTHQNGLSIDFMMPKIKNGEPYYELDNLGAQHYLLTFNNEGEYSVDKEVEIDFEAVAQHIYLLNTEAKKLGYRIAKVIIKTELKDELFATTYGAKIKTEEIYIVKSLSPIINALHDDHYHIDFEKI